MQVSARMLPPGPGSWPASPCSRHCFPGVAVGTGSGVCGGSAAGVTGLGSDVAAPAEAGTVAIAPPGVGVCSPQASRAARITRAVHSGIFSIHLPLDSSLVLT